jgi:Tfp pilus assembly protein PilZ
VVRESLSPRAERQLVQRHPSHKLTASIYCEVDGLPVEIEPLELSTAGLFVETPMPLSIDSEVEVFVRIGDMRFESTGHVVQTVSCEQASQRQRKPGYGLLFTNVDDTARAQLRRGIQALVVQRAGGARSQGVVGQPNAAPNRSLRAGPAAGSSIAARANAPLESRKPPAESRKPAVESRKPPADSPKPPVDSHKPRADSHKPPVDSHRPRTDSHKPPVESRQPPIQSRKPPMEPAKPAAESREPPTEARKAAVEAPQPVLVVASSLQPSAAPAINPAERQVLERLQAELRAVDAKPPWSVLGISQGADLAEAKRAFFAASKRYHPHLYARYSAPEIKPVVTELFIVHKRAYTSLLKSAKSIRQSVVEHAAVQRELSKQPGSGNK